MATLVGTQKDLADLLNALMELDLDAVEAYQVAIDKLQDPADKAQLQSFRLDHERHVRELRPFVERLGKEPIEAPDIKAVLTKGKVQIGALFGDRAILMAMKTNEDDTNTAYERATSRDDIPADIRYVLVRNLADERRHREYIELRLSEIEQRPAQQ